MDLDQDIDCRPDRQEERSSRIFLVSLRHGDDPTETRVMVRNVSRSGLGARASGWTPVTGETVHIDLGSSGEVEGVVRWVKGNLFGVALAQSIEPGNFDFSGKGRSVANKQSDVNQNYTRLRPVSDFRRPPLKTR